MKNHFLVVGLIVCVMAGSAFAAVEKAVMSADEALKLLEEGNGRFVAMKLERPNETSERREGTALHGQTPFAIVLACSDSRVPVETIFDRGIGDIFVVRDAGNIAMGSEIIGSVEYAALHLKVPLLVVMGHTECGAVEAAVSGAVVEGDIRDIQRKIWPVVQKVRRENPSLSGPELSKAAVKNNAIQSKNDLLNKSEELKELVDQGS